METATPQRMTIIILGGVLLAAVAVGAVIYFTPTLDLTQGQPNEQATGEYGAGTVSQTEGEFQGFDTAVLSQPKYTKLDASLFTRGLLPVQPPATAGKQNLFQ